MQYNTSVRDDNLQNKINSTLSPQKEKYNMDNHSKNTIITLTPNKKIFKTPEDFNHLN